MCKAIESVAGPQLLGVCCSYGGLGSEACAGSGTSVGVGVAVGSSAIGCVVAVTVGVTGLGVTGKAVGTGPGGSITFFA